MNNKGQAAALAFMLAIVVIILALAWVVPVNQMTSIAMNETTTSTVYDADGNAGTATTLGMQCTNTTISDFTKAACWVADLNQSYFIGGLIALAGVIIAARLIFAD